MPTEQGIGRVGCPICKGTGWATAAPKMIVIDEAASRYAEYPTVDVCECRGGPAQRKPPVDEMKLDAQSRAAGETD